MSESLSDAVREAAQGEAEREVAAARSKRDYRRGNAMSEYTPTTDDDTESFMCLAVLGAQECCAHCKSRFTEEKFKSWLTEVECAAAEKALTGVTDLIDAKAKAYADSATGLCAEKEWLDSNRYSNYASGLDMAAGLLHKAAAAYRREEA